MMHIHTMYLNNIYIYIYTHSLYRYTTYTCGHFEEEKKHVCVCSEDMTLFPHRNNEEYGNDLYGYSDVCMYACVNVCMYVISVWVFRCVYVCMCECMYVCNIGRGIQMCVCMHV